MEDGQPGKEMPWVCSCCAMDAEELAQALRDAGCTGQDAARLTGAREPGRLLELLARHRAALLDEVHRGEKKIDCLDYLVYQIKKSQGGRRGG